MPEFFKIALLFALTAVAEIVGCYLPWLVLKQGKSAWLLLVAALSLAVFVWLLTLKLPPFHGHLIVHREGVQDADT